MLRSVAVGSLAIKNRCLSVYKNENFCNSYCFFSVICLFLCFVVVVVVFFFVLVLPRKDDNLGSAVKSSEIKALTSTNV